MSLPLLDTYPSLEALIPHAALACLPTSMEQLENLPRGKSGNAWIKRDDLSHQEYGGNKIRKLDFIIAEAKSQGNNRIAYLWRDWH